MRIALLPDEYLPSGTRVHAKMFHELAVCLERLGHHPVVITPGTPSQPSMLVIDHIDNVEVWRFRAGVMSDIIIPDLAVPIGPVGWIRSIGVVASSNICRIPNKRLN